MSRPLLDDAFGHHVWATRLLIDACRALPEGQLDTTVPGTYGSIIATMRHIVAGVCGYLFTLTGGDHAEIDEAGMGLAELRAEMDLHEPVWSALVAREIDPDADVVRHQDDGTDSHAPLGIRLAQ